MAQQSAVQRRYFSWQHVHQVCLQSVHQLHEEFAPTLLVAISGGGLIPARLLRSGFKSKTGRTLPMQVIGAVRYDEDESKVNDTVVRTQWLSPDVKLSGQRILFVDEVDDSRKTLAYIVDEMLKYLDEARAAYEQSGNPEPWVEPLLATYVIHNKIRPKEAQIDSHVFPERYFVGLHVPNLWHMYPYDAMDIVEHTAIADAQEHYLKERPGELELAVAACAEIDASLAKFAATAMQHYAAPPPALALPQPPRGLPQRLNSLTRLWMPNVDLGSNSGSTQGPSKPVDMVEPDGHTHVDTDYVPSANQPINLSQTYVPKGYVPRIGSLTLVSLLDMQAPAPAEAPGAAPAPMVTQA